MKSFFWQDYTTEEFSQFDKDSTVIVLPIGAIEQHGPHLPVSVDTDIINALTSEITDQFTQQSVLFLPTIPVGYSPEHMNFSGSLTFSSQTLMSIIFDLAQSVHDSGFKHFLIWNSHGGNSNLIKVAAQDIYHHLGIHVYFANWYRLLDASEYVKNAQSGDIHGGAVETSLILAIDDTKVRKEKIDNFMPVKEKTKTLAYDGQVSYAWNAEDINQTGACGDAKAADKKSGKDLIKATAKQFIDLINDIHRKSREDHS